MSLEIYTQAEFYNWMVAYMVSNQSQITDFNDGSSIDAQLQAFATQLNKALVKASGGFKTQFEQIPFQTFNFEREDVSYASGTVVFSRDIADSTQINIGSGTVVGTSGGLLYTTQAGVSILSGNTDSAAANIIANDPGTDYNVQVGIVNILNSTVTGVNSVTNNTACAGGENVETNSKYFTRFTNYILGLSGCNRYGIFTAATTVSTIQSAYVEDEFPPASGIYNFTVYVDDGSGSVPATKLAEILLKIYGNDTADYQGFSAAGINPRVLTAGLVPVAVAYSATIDTVSYDASELETTIDAAVSNYINALWVGSDVLLSEVNRIIKSITGVTDISVITLNASAANVVTAASQVARVSTITGTIS